jgi:hypothetical protein
MKESEKELQKTNEWKDELKNMMPFLDIVTGLW